MLQKTISLWRRLIGQGEGAGPMSADVVHDERRLWARYSADLQGSAQLAERQGTDKILVKVRDLSLGGANLLVDQAVKPGQMLSLDLPTDSPHVNTVLACVVRAISHSEGKWSLGCVFSRELQSEDLGNFGAKKAEATDNDQRIWVRFPSELTASYRIVRDADAQSHPAKVLNISANGIGLAVQPSLEAGTLLNVDLLDKLGSVVRTMLACVVHTTQRDGDYAVGCNFIRQLSEEELHSLI